MLFWAQCRYSEIAQRIFKYSDIQYTTLTPDKILNSLVYRTLLYVNIYGSYKLLKTVRFFGPPCIIASLCGLIFMWPDMRQFQSKVARPDPVICCFYIYVCKAVVTCEIKSFWNNFIWHVTTSEIISKLFQPLKELWNYFEIIRRHWTCWKYLWATISLWTFFEVISAAEIILK